MRIIFMGTPDFAVSSLRAIYEAGHEICGVYTQPDRARNRGMKVSFGQVKKYAMSKGLKVYQPRSLKDDSVVDEISALAPDIIVVVAYGRLLTEDILRIPPLGVINVHASLLPKYRGAAPVQWAIINGEDRTGVSTMYMSKKLDAGDVIYTSETAIGEQETFGELYDRLAELGARLLLKTLEDIEKGQAERHPQDESLVTYAPLIEKSHRVIDWGMAPQEIVNTVRGLNPKPGAIGRLAHKDFKIFKAEKAESELKMDPGKIISADDNGLLVACGHGEAVLITELQAPGGRRMLAGDYLRGNKLEN